MEKKISKNEVVRCLYKTKKIQAFLRKHKCLTTFIRQINNHDLAFVHDTIIKDEVAITIMYAFTWEKSKEGVDFWKNLYEQALLII